MDYKESYIELLETNKRLEKELESIRSTSREKTDIIRETIFRIFHSASYLMAISKLDTGQYVDINEAFQKALGYSKEEIIGHTSDDIRLFSDFGESNKYIKLISKLKSVKDYPITLKTKTGEERVYLFSADRVNLENEVYLLTVFTEINAKDRNLKDNQGRLLAEIIETLSHYIILFSIDSDKRFYVNDLNKKAEEVEKVNRKDIVGKYIEETPLVNRLKLVELLNHLHLSGDTHKLPASSNGDDSEGYYMGFLLSSGNFVITWEPGNRQRFLDDLNKQDLAFRQFADLLPEMVYEVDLSGKIVYGNKQGLCFFGYSEEDIVAGINIADVFPDSYKEMIKNLKALSSPEQISSNEYYGRKKSGELVPVVTHSFGIFYNDKIIGYRGVVRDISRQKEYESQIIREKAFLEHLYNSTPVAIAITSPAGVISMINREFTNLFGYTLEEAVNKNINDLVVPDELKEEAEKVDNLASLNRREVRQTIRKDKSGNRIHVTLVATAIVINNEIVANLGIYRDISTERKNQLLQEILFNISTAALKQYDIKEIYPIIVQELSKIWDTNNFFIALYDKNSETLSLPFFTDEKDNFYEIPTKKTITGWVINNNKSVLLKQKDLQDS